MVFCVVNCRQDDDASIARRTSTAEALTDFEREAVRGWAFVEIRRRGLAIDEITLR